MATDPVYLGLAGPAGSLRRGTRKAYREWTRIDANGTGSPALKRRDDPSPFPSQHGRVLQACQPPFASIREGMSYVNGAPWEHSGRSCLQTRLVASLGSLWTVANFDD